MHSVNKRTNALVILGCATSTTTTTKTDAKTRLKSVRDAARASEASDGVKRNVIDIIIIIVIILRDETPLMTRLNPC
jgi:hypothetical protein